ncbi:MAG: alpha/beta fold hydrolase [Rhodobacteraceae bacterium]|nr:alpha/beta fold hydrolase [Paracoccaceae bacterium]
MEKQEMTVKINGEPLYTLTMGDGPPILLMHGGLGLSHDYLRPYFDTLARTSKIIYYDHLGNGRSARPAKFSDLTFPRLVSDGIALMDHFGHEKFTLIGHSYGGFIAQMLAAMHPERLNGLVLLNTIPTLDYAPPISGARHLMTAFEKLFSQPMADNSDWQSTWGRVIQLYFKSYDAAVGAALDASTVYEHRAWNAGNALLGDFNMLDALPDLKVPALVMGGLHDKITPPGPGAERIAGLLPNATLRLFEQAAHYPFIEEQKKFFDVLEDWLSKLK